MGVCFESDTKHSASHPKGRLTLAQPCLTDHMVCNDWLTQDEADEGRAMSGWDTMFVARVTSSDIACQVMVLFLSLWELMPAIVSSDGSLLEIKHKCDYSCLGGNGKCLPRFALRNAQAEPNILQASLDPPHLRPPNLNQLLLY